MAWVMTIYCGVVLATILVGFSGEKSKPGKVGRIRVRKRRVRDLRPLLVLGRFVLGSTCLVGCCWILVSSWAAVSAGRGLLAIVLFVAYLVASNVLEPEPEWSNMGFAMGLIDDPLRLSDDWNRTLRALQVLFIPGRVMIEGIGDALILAFFRRGPGYRK